MIARFALLVGALLISFTTVAQSYNITGRIIDEKDTSALIGVTVIARNTADTSIKPGAATDLSGNFEIDGLSPGSYQLRIEYIGYNTVTRSVRVEDKNIRLGTITMKSKSNELKGVTIEAKQIRAEQSGDTSQFRADAYKTHPDATAEDLVTKMPGVTSDNSGVKVNGEAVQQVYVDGKPFFGTDPTLALKNLPAEVIDKIQVFDKLSDQSAFTGFDDGNTQKTMNIVTKRGKSEGTFGKVYAGYGTDDTYIAGGNINFFNGDQRVSILGLSNNINQQNFGSQDLLGISGGSGQGRGNRGGSYGNSSTSSGANNFLVNQQNGITTTNSAGINYSDDWGKKIKVTASYFFNSTDNVNNTSLVRNYFTGVETGNVYNETDHSESINYNHRFNMRLEYNIDSFNAIIFTPSVNFQQNNSPTSQIASTDSAGRPLSGTANRSTAFNNGYNSSGSLLIQHKFKKPRRTISLNINSSVGEKNGNGTYVANDTEFYYSPVFFDSITPLNQYYTQYSNNYTVGGNLSYTEPIGKKSQLMVNYYPSVTKSIADRETYNYDYTAEQYSIFNDTLSNKYHSTYDVQKGGLSYRVGDRKMILSIGANAQYATLSGQEVFPASFNIEKNFTNVLPTAFFNYRFSDGRNLRIMYRTNTTAPTITQLQDVVDVSNPLLMNTGNRNLRQDYEQTLVVRYGLTKSKTAHNFFLYLYGNAISDYIGNKVYQFARDTIFQGPAPDAPVQVRRGSQLTMPVNLNGYYSTRAFATYSVPADIIKSNLNFNGGFNFTQSPGVLNNVVNYSDNYVPSAGIVLSSNVSEKLDFTLAYSGNYNIIKNTLQTQTSNNYYSHVASFKINYIFLKNFVVNTNITHNYYTAFSSTGGQSYFLWNAYLGYKMLKKQALEARISAFDILNQNKSITRTVTGTYVENDVTTVLKQYFMFQLTYTIRNFKGAIPGEGDKRDNGPFGPGGNPGGHSWPGHDHGGGMN